MGNLEEMAEFIQLLGIETADWTLDDKLSLQLGFAAFADFYNNEPTLWTRGMTQEQYSHITYRILQNDFIGFRIFRDADAGQGWELMKSTGLIVLRDDEDFYIPGEVGEAAIKSLLGTMLKWQYK